MKHVETTREALAELRGRRLNAVISLKNGSVGLLFEGCRVVSVGTFAVLDEAASAVVAYNSMGQLRGLLDEKVEALVTEAMESSEVGK